MPTKPPTFRPAHMPTRQEVSRDYDQRRGSARERGYTAEWDNEAWEYRNQNPLCVGCAAIGITRQADLVDHIEPHKGDMVKFWDRDNWQSSCTFHHSEIKQTLERLWLRGEIKTKDLRLDSAIAVKLSIAEASIATGRASVSRRQTGRLSARP